MKINVSGILNIPGASQDFAFTVNKVKETAGLTLGKPVQISGSVVNTGELLQLKAHVKAEASGSCDRCLDQVNIPVEFEIEEFYRHRGEYTKDAVEEDRDHIVFTGDYLDLEETLRENLLLNIPMRVLCSPSCPGMCPKCGQNLKAGKCECPKEVHDTPFAILAKLKENM